LQTKSKLNYPDVHTTEAVWRSRTYSSANQSGSFCALNIPATFNFKSVLVKTTRTESLLKKIIITQSQDKAIIGDRAIMLANNKKTPYTNVHTERRQIYILGGPKTTQSV